jgi:hypothetical protein
MFAEKFRIPARSFFLPSERAETVRTAAYAIFARVEGPEGLYRPDDPVLALEVPCGSVSFWACVFLARFRDTIPP